MSQRFTLAKGGAVKRIINGKTAVNQLVPFKYKWAWDKYLAGAVVPLSEEMCAFPAW